MGSNFNAVNHCFSAAGIVLRQLHLVAPAVRVDADARTAGTPEKIVDWLLRDLSGDVPQRLLNARHGTIELQRAPSLRVVIKRNLRHVADVERVAANKITAEFFDLRGDCTVPVVLAVGLAPSDDATIGLDPHENEVLTPTGIDRKTFDAGDFHCAPRYIRTPLKCGITAEDWGSEIRTADHL